MFIVSMYTNNCPKHNLGFEGKCVAKFLGRFSFQPLKENSLFGPSSSTLEKLGALEWFKVRHKGQGWRLITCIWLNASIIHLLANMLSLVFIVIRLEQQFGVGCRTLLIIVAINLAAGILPHVDNFAHIDGFLTGFLLGFILLPRP